MAEQDIKNSDQENRISIALANDHLNKNEDGQVNYENLNDPSDIDQMHRYQTLEAGQYWKAKKDSEYFEKDEVLLVTKIDWVDNKPHTLYIAVHPLKVERFNSSFKMLTEDFLNSFDFEPDAEEIRNREILNIQKTVSDLQKELIETQADPVKFAAVVAKEISEPLKITKASANTVSDGMDMIMNGQSLESVRQNAAHQIKVAEATTGWITKKVDAIAEAMNSLTPFLTEKTMVSLARTGDIKRQVEKMLRGIESMDLYIGKYVEVDNVTEGESAPAEEKVLLMQRKLYMSHELAVHVDIDEDFDEKSVPKFLERLRTHQDFRDQVFPSKRCVVLMGITDRQVNYSDNPILNEALNRNNLSSFLLIRDGENINAVFSNIDSHISAKRLFPLRDETDRVFRGFDGRNINFQDLDYTGRLDNHEALALHYKRFLILLCGLDHRLGLLGKFYSGPQGFDFISQEFQDQYFVFAEEDSPYLISNKPKLPNDGGYITDKNGAIQSGSRLMCWWSKLVSEKTAPSFYKTGYGDFLEEASVAIAYERDGEVFVDCPLKGGKHSSVKVKLKMHDREFDGTHAYIVLDRVDPEIIKRYIGEREHRPQHVGFMRLFRRADVYLSEERRREAAARLFLRDAALSARLVTEDNVDEAVSTGIANWRASHRGKDLPALSGNRLANNHDAILEHVYFAAGHGQQAISLIREHFEATGEEVIRISMTGQCNLVVYLEASKEDKKGIPFHPWIKRLTLEITKNQVKVTGQRFTLLRETLHEVTLLSNDSVKGHIDCKDPGITREQFIESSARVMNFSKALELLKSPNLELVNTLVKEYSKLRRELSTKMVHEPVLHIPFALFKNPDGKINFLSLSAFAIDILLKLGQKLDPHLGAKIMREYASIYRHQEDRFKEASRILEMQQLTGTEANVFSVNEIFMSESDITIEDLTISSGRKGWYNSWNRKFDNIRYGLEDNMKLSLDAVRNDKHAEILILADIAGCDARAGLATDYPSEPYVAAEVRIRGKDEEYTWVGIIPYTTKSDTSFTSQENFKTFFRGLGYANLGTTNYYNNSPMHSAIYPTKEAAIEKMQRLHPAITYVDINGCLYGTTEDPAFINKQDLVKAELPVKSKLKP